jgi:predicted nucleic acid-binding protein
VICVDASVAVKWLLIEEHSELARRLLVTSLGNAEQLVAPPLLPSDITNAVRQRIRRGDILPDEGPALLADFLAIPVVLHASELLYQRALAIAVDLGLSATYDAQYVALSELLGAAFWTADERLFNAAASRMPFVNLIRDYAN